MELSIIQQRNLQNDQRLAQTMSTSQGKYYGGHFHY